MNTEETKRESEETEEQIEQTPENTSSNFFTTTLGKIAIVVVLLVVSISGVLYWQSLQKENAQKASLALSRIRTYYESGDYQRALNGDPGAQIRGESIQGLSSIVSEYGSTASGKTAAYYAGVAYVNLKKYSEATAMFEKASGSESDVVKAGALAGLAVIAEHNNNFASASEQYVKASGLAQDDVSKARFLYFSAICLEKISKKEEAISQFKEVVNKYSQTEYAGDSKAGLVRLGTIID